ncbi:hypothetical protein OIO90_004697 [Microbotryomycetes sp. JL221]|nr:hypothetical protein OIO90_004697 [Microbotryomycetes sp. JL221]
MIPSTLALGAAALLLAAVPGVDAAPKYLSMQGIKRPQAHRVKPAPIELTTEFNTDKAVELNNDSGADPQVKAPYKNVWASLTNDEAASVIKFLHEKADMNLTAAADATEWDNWIGTVDLAAVKKSEALKYTSGETNSPPSRYAKAIINFQATDTPYLEEYLIGPLPVSDSTKVQPYTAGHTRGKGGSGKQMNFDADSNAVYEWMLSEMEPLTEVYKGLTGYGPQNMSHWGIDPLWKENGRVIKWVQAWGDPENGFGAQTLLPQGIYCKMDITGRDPAGWSIEGWLYNDVFYSTTAEFLEAYKSPDFVKMTPNKGQNESWIGTDQAGDPLPYDTRAPPMQVLPEGKRWAVDNEENYVTWGDFSFYVGFTRDTGVRLFDIKYKGERVIYELGLQEAIAHYAGNDPVQSGIGYLDSYYGFGPYTFELIAGFDCPTYSSFMDTTFHTNEVSTKHRHAICLFESDVGYPMQRHSSSDYISITKNVAFTLRSVATVGNYDYSFSYVFYQDGSIETFVQASGYIQSAYYAQNNHYGYQIHDGLSGSMHDHALTFKADVDILGTANTLKLHKVAKTNAKYVWSNTTRSTMWLERSNITNEDHGKRDFHIGDMYIIGNYDAKNKYGEARGYRMMPGRGHGMKLTIENSDNLLKSQSFATNNFYVTKHKDDENACAHSSNAYDPANPVVEFAKFFDSEDLVQEDIVLWYNLGMNHVPHTGDLPNTVQTTAQASMIFTPHNYLYSDPSRQTSQMLRLNYNSSADYIVSEVETFGSHQPSGQYNFTASQVDYMSYKGDINVRKFPYDPLNPFNATTSI